MKDEKKFVIDTFKKVYGVTDLAEELFVSDDDPNQVDDDKVQALIVEYDKKKISGIKTKSFDQGAQAREKKVKQDIEEAIKTKFGIDAFDNDDLDALIDHAVSLKPAGKAGELTPEQIEALPHVIGLKRNFSKTLTEKETEFNQKLTAKEEEKAREKLQLKVNTIALKKLTEKNPVLPEDKAKADRRITKDLLEELTPYGWLEQDGEIIPLGKDGKQVTTANDVPVTLDDLIDDLIDSNFDFAPIVQTPTRTSSKNGKIDPKPNPDNKPAYTGKIPDNEKEYLALINDKSLSVAQRVSIRDQYKKKKGL